MQSSRACIDESGNDWRTDSALLVVLCVLVLWLGLGKTRLWDQDEGYYASVAREMFDRRDWIVPTFNQELFAHKPPLMYWGMLTGFHLFGVSEFATRWVSAIFGTGMVLLTYRLGRLLIDRKTALIASLVLASSLMFTVVARSATADVHLGFFILLALTLWVSRASAWSKRGVSEVGDFPEIPLRTWLMIYLAIAFAVLSKGPIGFAFPVAILGTLTFLWPWVCGQTIAWKEIFSVGRFVKATLSMRPFAGAIVLLSVAAPWFWIVNQRTDGAFLAEFFGEQHLARFSKPMDNHSGPIYYYLVASLIGFFPWTSFAIPIGLHALWAKRSVALRLAWAVISVWLFFYFVVFSVASTKLPNYIIPAYPALALWIGSYFSGWLDRLDDEDIQRGNLWPMAGWLFMIFSGALIGGITLAIGSRFGDAWVDRLEIDRKMLPAILTFSWLGWLLIGGGLVGLYFQSTKKRAWGVWVLASLCVGWVSLIWQLIIPGIDRFQTPQQVAIETIAPMQVSALRGEPAVVGMFRPSMVFYSRGPLNFCPDDRALEETLSIDPPSLVVINQSSQKAKQMLDEHGYRIADSLESFPKRGLISVYRK